MWRVAHLPSLWLRGTWGLSRRAALPAFPGSYRTPPQVWSVGRWRTEDFTNRLGPQAEQDDWSIFISKVCKELIRDMGMCLYQYLLEPASLNLAAIEGHQPHLFFPSVESLCLICYAQQLCRPAQIFGVKQYPPFIKSLGLRVCDLGWFWCEFSTGRPP